MIDTSNPRFATTLARGLSVLRAFRVGDEGLSNGEIARRTGLPKSTVSRLTYTLKQLGYLTQGMCDDRFRLGPTIVAVGHVAAASLSYLTPADRLVKQLVLDTGLMVALVVREFDKIVLIRRWRPPEAPVTRFDVSQRMSLRRLSSWRGLLAALPEEQAEAILALAPSPEEAEQLRRDRPKAQTELLTRGFVTTPADPDVAHYGSVGVPFQGGNLTEPVVFVCGGPPELATEERLEQELGPKLAATIRELAKITGHSVPLQYLED